MAFWSSTLIRSAHHLRGFTQLCKINNCQSGAVSALCAQLLVAAPRLARSASSASQDSPVASLTDAPDTPPSDTSVASDGHAPAASPSDVSFAFPVDVPDSLPRDVPGYCPSDAPAASSSDSSDTRPNNTALDSEDGVPVACTNARLQRTPVFITDEQEYVHVWSDGSCRSNGLSDARAGIGVWFGANHPLNVSAAAAPPYTNNCAELQAAIRAIRLARAAGFTRVLVHTDSQFVIYCATEWIPKWQFTGRTVDSRKQVRELARAMDGAAVKWNQVRSRSDDGNTGADRLAKAASKMKVKKYANSSTLPNRPEQSCDSTPDQPESTFDSDLDQADQSCDSDSDPSYDFVPDLSCYFVLDQADPIFDSESNPNYDSESDLSFHFVLDASCDSLPDLSCYFVADQPDPSCEDASEEKKKGKKEKKKKKKAQPDPSCEDASGEKRNGKKKKKKKKIQPDPSCDYVSEASCESVSDPNCDLEVDHRDPSCDPVSGQPEPSCDYTADQPDPSCDSTPHQSDLSCNGASEEKQGKKKNKKKKKKKTQLDLSCEDVLEASCNSSRDQPDPNCDSVSCLSCDSKILMYLMY